MAEPRDTKRAQLLGACETLFVDPGYERTSVGDIARHAESGPATFYRHFGTKAEALRELMAPRLARIAEELAALGGDEADPFARALRGMRIAALQMQSDPLIASLFFQRAQSGELAVEFQRLAALVDQHFVSLLEEGSTNGPAPVADPEAVVAWLRCTFDGWFLLEASRPGGVSLERVLDVMEGALSYPRKRSTSAIPRERPKLPDT